MTSAEALGWWLAGRPQTEARGPFIETRIPLDRETSERLLYLSKRFAIPKRTLLRELVRAAVDDIFAVIPSDQPLAGLVCDPGDGRVTPEGAREGKASDANPQRVRPLLARQCRPHGLRHHSRRVPADHEQVLGEGRWHRRRASGRKRCLRFGPRLLVPPQARVGRPQALGGSFER